MLCFNRTKDETGETKESTSESTPGTRMNAAAVITPTIT
jgi:hypothetical protein